MAASLHCIVRHNLDAANPNGGFELLPWAANFNEAEGYFPPLGLAGAMR
jgi:hypothetical protein